MSHDPRAQPPETLRPGWKSVVLVCKACEKRSKAPKKLGARELAKALGRACREAKVPRSRVVLTTCLGACPKRALTVAAAAPSGRLTMIAFHRGDDAAAAVATLFAPGSTTPDESGFYSNSTSSTPSAT